MHKSESHLFKRQRKSSQEDDLIPLVKTLIKKKIDDSDSKTVNELKDEDKELEEFLESIKAMLKNIKKNDELYQKTKFEIVKILGDMMLKVFMPK